MSAVAAPADGVSVLLGDRDWRAPGLVECADGVELKTEDAALALCLRRVVIRRAE
jgi:hypothetical protein